MRRMILDAAVCLRSCRRRPISPSLSRILTHAVDSDTGSIGGTSPRAILRALSARAAR